MVDAGLIVLTAFISPFRAERAMARSLLAEGEFIEVYVDTPLEVAEQRDVKGLYAKARRGELTNFTGIDSPYEAPEAPELRVATTVLSRRAGGRPGDRRRAAASWALIVHGMTLQQGVVFAGLAVLVVELVRGKRSPAAVFAGVAFAFILLDYVSLQTGLQQFTNTGLVTVVVLLLLSVVLDKSRLLEQAGRTAGARPLPLGAGQAVRRHRRCTRPS